MSKKTNKISLVLITGLKYPIGKRFSIGIDAGIGFSLPSMYWYKEVYYNQPDDISRVGEDAWVGYLTHLSVIGRLSVGYRIGS